MLENAKNWPVFHPLTILDATEQLLTVPPALPLWSIPVAARFSSVAPMRGRMKIDKPHA
jgi:hypothetical protein